MELFGVLGIYNFAQAQKFGILMKKGFIGRPHSVYRPKKLSLEADPHQLKVGSTNRFYQLKKGVRLRTVVRFANPGVLPVLWWA